MIFFRFRNNLSALSYQQAESADCFLNRMAESAFLGLQFNSHEELINAIQQVSAKDVANVASKLIKGKVAIAAVGQTANVPYAEDLL